MDRKIISVVDIAEGPDRFALVDSLVFQRPATFLIEENEEWEKERKGGSMSCDELAAWLEPTLTELNFGGLVVYVRSIEVESGGGESWNIVGRVNTDLVEGKHTFVSGFYSTKKRRGRFEVWRL